jgi:hypothetical protein
MRVTIRDSPDYGRRWRARTPALNLEAALKAVQAMTSIFMNTNETRLTG